MTKNNNHGFTLLESLIYIALFGILMSGALAGIAALTESANRNDTQALLEDEGTFLLGKIDYEVASTNSLSVQNAVQNATEVLTSLANPHVPLSNLEITQYFTASSTPGISATNPAYEALRTSFTLSATTSSGQHISESFSHLSSLTP
jgi:prepilin-type N-terminal cleavage/methylation domain-containing protein